MTKELRFRQVPAGAKTDGPSPRLREMTYNRLLEAIGAVREAGGDCELSFAQARSEDGWFIVPVISRDAA